MTSKNFEYNYLRRIQKTRFLLWFKIVDSLVFLAKCGYCKLLVKPETADDFHDKLFDPIRKDVIDRKELTVLQSTPAARLQ